MKNRQYYSQDVNLGSRGIQRGKSRPLSILSCLGGLALCIVLAAAAFGGYYFLAPAGEAGPLVLIHAPRNGEHIIVGQPTTVQAVASDERKIVRVELWVDGQLLNSETSNVSGGIASFPLLADWQPASAGPHTIMVRAFNSLGVRAHSSININVTADRDGDGVADDADACPDQQGLDVSNGCPDRDMDGTPDSADACPDVAGVPEAGGCAAVVEGDHDGDGASDTVDICPDAPGSPLLEGCPDSDSDLVADIHDTCAGEPGAGASDGCPAPAGDADGDGVPDSGDVCPSEWGLPEHGGCPEVLPGSDDGVVPGSGTSDSDGDDASDDVDPCPTEAGSPENGFCPPPGEDPAPSEEESMFELPGFFFRATMPTWVEFEALHFEVSDHYREIWCYVQLAGGDVERYEFDPGPGRQWDIAEVLGGGNSVQLALTQSDPVNVFVECYGKRGFFDLGRPDYLGSITQQHPSSVWNGYVLEMESTGGDHSFQVRYHLCSPSCEATALQPPVITRSSVDRDKIHLDWEWEGDRHLIDGFKLYHNGNLVGVYPREESDMTWELRSLYCVDRWDFTMTTYSGSNAEAPDLESPPGNTVFVEGVECRKSIRVTFATLNLHDAPTDDGGRDDQGPLAGTFTATAGANMESVSFHAVHCVPFPFPPFEICFGPRLGEGEHSIQRMFDRIHQLRSECETSLCHARHYGASESDTVTIYVNPGDELTIAARIMDADEGNPNDTLFNEQATIDTADLSPDSTFTLTIPGGHADLIVLIDLYPPDP